MIVAGAGARFAALSYARERFVFGYFPGDAPVAADEARPQYDAVRQGIAGGDAVGEEAG